MYEKYLSPSNLGMKNAIKQEGQSRMYYDTSESNS